jgi:hypothetical protein
MDLDKAKALLFFQAARNLANDPKRIELLLSEMKLQLVSKLTVVKKANPNAK